MCATSVTVYAVLRVSVGFWIDRQHGLFLFDPEGEQWPYRRLRARQKLTTLQVFLIRLAQVSLVVTLVLGVVVALLDGHRR